MRKISHQDAFRKFSVFKEKDAKLIKALHRKFQHCVVQKHECIKKFFNLHLVELIDAMSFLSLKKQKNKNELLSLRCTYKCTDFHHQQNNNESFHPSFCMHKMYSVQVVEIIR